MRILVLGSGAREHALSWKIAQNPTLDKIFFAPGNGGMAELGECVRLDPANPAEVAKFVEAQGIDLTVIGPEGPLVAGVADELASRGLPVFGPGRAGAQLEASKAWAKDLMSEAGVPTPDYGTFRNLAEARAFIAERMPPFVVKADGLAAGKGVLVCEDSASADAALRACLEQRAFGEAGDVVVVEEFLEGRELSMFCLSDGRDVLPLIEARDYKRAFDGDRGPNTGGMGAYSPVADASGVVETLRDLVFRPVIDALDARGIRYVGVLYAGLMLTKTGPKVLEFNARFGDPETQPLVRRLESDLVELLLSCVEGNLRHYRPRWHPEACVGVVVASRNYPESSPAGLPITGLDAANAVPGAVVFHAGTALRDGRTVTAGGRVVTVTALGRDLPAARDRAYEAAALVHFSGKRMRGDIAAHEEE